MNECKGNPRLQKAVAMAVYIKFKLGRSSLMKDYSINKIHDLTGISATTIKKYMPILVEHGWLLFSGNDKRHMTIGRLCSQTEKRNICIDKFCYKSYKDVYRSLRAFLFLIIQSHKDFVKRTIQIATDPKRGEDFKAARKLVKRLVKQKVIGEIYDKYKEFGISLKRIAKETGNCIRTAQEIVKYAIKKHWAKKQNNFDQMYVQGCYYRSINFFPFAKDYTFSTKNNLYKINANTYKLSKGISKDVTREVAWHHISW